MAQQRALPQSKETLLQSYNKRLRDDIKSMMDNFTEIIKTAKVGGDSEPRTALLWPRHRAAWRGWGGTAAVGPGPGARTFGGARGWTMTNRSADKPANYRPSEAAAGTLPRARPSTQRMPCGASGQGLGVLVLGPW